MENHIEIREGWHWPIKDKTCFLHLKKRLKVPANISSFVDQKEVVVQAGGNAGIYPKIYQEIFQRVYTFEPDPLNFYCLSKNTGQNVFKFQCCLGKENQMVNLNYHEFETEHYNIGGYRVSGSGSIPTISLDSLGLDRCDLIHLDVEGFEGNVLLGGENLIKKFQPIIALELRGHGEKYGWPDQRIIDLLNDWGYSSISGVKEDVIFRSRNYGKS